MADSFKKLDLDDWVQTGGGMLGTSYFHRSNPRLMLKMGNFDTSIDDWKKEIENGKALIAAGVSTPDPGFIVSDGEHYGIVFERIPDKISYAKAIGLTSCDEQIDELARTFADDVKALHGTVNKGFGLRNVKDVLKDGIERNTVRSRKCIDSALRLLGTLPDADTVLHGDLHFGNVIRSGGRDYFIDVGDAAYGCPSFGLAMFAWVMAMCDSVPEDFHIGLYHHSFSQARRFYQSFVDSYFGHPIDTAALERELLPYMSLRLLYIESKMENDIQSAINDRIVSYLELM